MHKRLQDGLSASEIILALNPDFEPMLDLSKKFRSSAKDRIIDVNANSKPMIPSNSAVVSNDATISQENFNGGGPRIAKFIEKQIGKS